MPARRSFPAPHARSGCWWAWLLALPILWAVAAPAHAQAPVFLVRDIHPGPGGSFPGSVNTRFGAARFLVDLNGTLLFRADDGVTGTELWRTDGTEAGTVLVKDIVPGP